MPATLATFQNILKEFYIGPVLEEINQEVFVIEMFEKAVVDWQGRVAIIPVHISRNTGVGFRQEGGGADTLPDAGEQGYERLQVHAQYHYGRFQITGPAIAAAKSGGKGAFIGYVDAEMKKLVNDIKNSANQVSVCGNAVRGYITDKYASLPGTGNPGLAAAPASFSSQPMSYNGDFTAFSGCVAVTPGTWVPVRLIRTDTFQDLPLFHTAPLTNVNIMVGAADANAGTITIAWGDGAGAVGGLGDLQTDMITDGYGIAVAIDYRNATDAGGNPLGLQIAAPSTAAVPLAPETSNVSLTALEPVGIYGNVSDSAYFGMTRANGAANEVPQMQGYALNQNTGLPIALTGFNALSLDRIQQSLDIVHTDGVAVPVVTPQPLGLSTGGGTTPDGGGMDPDIIMMNPVTRQQYTTLLQGTNSANLMVETSKAKNGDAGFLSLGYGGIPIKTSRAVHRGILCFLSKSTWVITELESAGFADMDGNVLSRLLAVDAYQGFYRWYWNLVCKQPNTNVVLFGITP